MARQHWAGLGEHNWQAGRQAGIHILVHIFIAATVRMHAQKAIQFNVATRRLSSQNISMSEQML